MQPQGVGQKYGLNVWEKGCGMCIVHVWLHWLSVEPLKAVLPPHMSVALSLIWSDVICHMYKQRFGM
jgi:hypothetical protein